jgi:hypothetical protein
VSEEMEVELGDEVGYAIRFEDCTSPKTVIKYMTDGVLLRESLREADLDNYSALIMDEAHERSLHTDVLFGILKKIAARRRDLKVARRQCPSLPPPPPFASSSHPHPRTPSLAPGDRDVGDAQRREVFVVLRRRAHLPHPRPHVPRGDLLRQGALRRLRGRGREAGADHPPVVPPGGHPGLHDGPGGHRGHLPGAARPRALLFFTSLTLTPHRLSPCQVLAERISTLEKVPPLLLLPMYSQLPADLQAKIFESANAGTRKCIVSTNIAETSLTVDGIKYVVDCGYNKLKVYNPRIGMDALQVRPYLDPLLGPYLSGPYLGPHVAPI